jgi:hypothetical protein
MSFCGMFTGTEQFKEFHVLGVGGQSLSVQTFLRVIRRWGSTVCFGTQRMSEKYYIGINMASVI